MKWKGIEQEQQDNKKALAQSDKYLDEGKRFEHAWRKFDSSKQQTGMIDLMEAHTFIKAIVPKAEIHIETSTPDQKAAEDLIEQSLF